MSTSEPRLPFAAKAEQCGDDYDVVMIYEMLLGRSPENDRVIEQARQQPVERFMMSALNSDEFKDSVHSNFSKEGSLPHLKFSKGPTRDQLNWFSSFLTLGAEDMDIIARIKTWTEFLALVLRLKTGEPHTSGADPVAAPAAAAVATVEEAPGTPAAAASVPDDAPAPADAEKATESGDVMAASPEPEPIVEAPTSRDLLVVVEALDRTFVKGWGLNLESRDEPLTLSFMSQGRALGSTRCDAMRPDLQRVLGGSGSCGFSFDLGSALEATTSPVSEITIHDGPSGAMVAGPLPIPAPTQTAKAALNEPHAFVEWLASSLSELKSTVATLRTEVEGLKAAALPRSGEDAVRRGTDAAPWALSADPESRGDPEAKAAARPFPAGEDRQQPRVQ